MRGISKISPAGAPARAPEGKVTLVVIDPRASVREQIAVPLWPYYRILDFANIEAAAAGTSGAPSAVLLGENAFDKTSAAALAALRQAPLFGGATIIACLPAQSRLVTEWVSTAAVDGRIDLPFRCGDMAILLSRLNKASLRKEWAKLPSTPRQALRRTLDAYDNLAELISKNAPLDYRTITDACAPVLSAVRRADHSYIFDALTRLDDLIYVHSLRVSTLLAMFGFKIGLNDEELMTLACGGLLLDLGKTMLPFEVLHKPGSLTAAEWELVRDHVDMARRYVERQSSAPRGIQVVIAEHHERLDGSGYPGRMSGDRLNDLARMAAIVDVFAALTEARPYRPAFSSGDALDILSGTMKEQVDQGLLSSFRQTLPNTWA